MSYDDSRSKDCKAPFVLVHKKSLVNMLSSKEDTGATIKIEGKEIMKVPNASTALLYVFGTYFLFNTQYELPGKEICTFLERFVFEWTIFRYESAKINELISKLGLDAGNA